MGALCVAEMSLKSAPSADFITKLMQRPRREQSVQQPRRENYTATILTSPSDTRARVRGGEAINQDRHQRMKILSVNMLLLVRNNLKI